MPEKRYTQPGSIFERRLLAVIRDAIDTGEVDGWQLLQHAGRMYEGLCIPGVNTMPDDPIMLEDHMTEAAAMWAQISSVQRQAEEGGDRNLPGHHDYAEAVVLTIAATASLLQAKGIQDEAYRQFCEKVGITPEEFLKHYFVLNPNQMDF